LNGEEGCLLTAFLLDANALGIIFEDFIKP